MRDFGTRPCTSSGGVLMESLAKRMERGTNSGESDDTGPPTHSAPVPRPIILKWICTYAWLLCYLPLRCYSPRDTLLGRVVLFFFPLSALLVVFFPLPWLLPLLFSFFYCQFWPPVDYYFKKQTNPATCWPDAETDDNRRLLTWCRNSCKDLALPCFCTCPLRQMHCERWID